VPTDTDPRRSTAAPARRGEPSGPWLLPKLGDRTLIGLALVGVALALAVFTGTWWFRESFFLDDYVLCGSHRGIEPVWTEIWALTGIYRPLTYPIVAFRTLTCDVFVIHKVLGFGLHVLAGVLMYRLVARLKLGVAAAFTAAVVWIFNPLALEAAAWAAPVYGYPLVAVLLLAMALELLRDDPRWWLAGLLGLGAAMTNEVAVGAVAVITLLAVGGAPRRRLGLWLRVMWPTLAYLAAVSLSARIVSFERSSAFGPDGVANLVTNIGWLRGSFLPLAPVVGEQWRAFTAGAYGPRELAGLVALGAAGFLIAVLGHRRSKQPRVAGRTLVLVAVAGALVVLALLAPFIAQGIPYVTPRYAYLPQLGFALLAALLVHVLGRVVEPRWWLLLSVPLLWALVTADGLSRDSEAYSEAFDRDRANAIALASAVSAANPTRIVLVNDPWSFAGDAPLIGDHIVQPLAVEWAGPGATIVLAGTRLDAPLIIDRGGSALCARDGAVELQSTALDAPSEVLVYDVAALSPVGRLELPGGGQLSMGRAGATHQIPSCS